MSAPAGRITAHAPSSSTAHGWAVLGIVAVALLLRMVFYTGYFGSDEVTYVESGFKLLSGDWQVSDYVGANRYGVNLPIAAFGALLGRHEWSAAAFSMLCSLAEIALVAGMGRRLVGDRAALLAALILACLPTHVHLAGRIMADAPLSLAITASFLFFFDGELRAQGSERDRRNGREGRRSYFIAGCAAGLTFWIKPAAMIYLAVFLLYPLFLRRFDLRWGWMVLGFAVVVAANNLLFLILTGDALYLFKAMKSRQASGYLEAEAVLGAIKDSPLYYPGYLLFKVHHTWLLGHLALLGLVLWLRTRLKSNGGARAAGLTYVVFWSIGLLAMLSLLVISWSPLMFVPKQTNYMLMFTTPLALLAGHVVAHLQGARLAAALALVLVPSVLLAALHQSVVHVFTANSKAAVSFAAANPQAAVFANTNPHRAAMFHNLVRPEDPPVQIGSMAELKSLGSAANAGTAARQERFVILDQTTLAWASSEPIRRLEDAPACWAAHSTLQPIVHGLGWRLQIGLLKLADGLPAGLGAEAVARWRKQASPQRAVVYRVPAADCP